MSVRITIGVTAKNEEACIAGTLESLLRSIAFAEAAGVAQFDLVAILDECSDGTERVVRGFPGIEVIRSTGGLIEAQRQIAYRRPFVIYSDADILVGENVVAELAHTMIGEPAVQVAYPTKRPLAPARRTLLASALYCYNRVEGFQRARRYFNGKLFAIRDWKAPTLEELAPRLAALPHDCFYNFHAGLQADDIWLSRDILLRHGPDVIREVSSAEIFYRPPETFTGMYRMYLRMRREIERLDRIFPETRPAHQNRGYDREAERRAPFRDRLLWRVFRIALGVCRVRYVAERCFYQHFARSECSAWKPITETKVPLSGASVPPA
jgi:glycosyltransferase involved in cell wall biosynthesis